MANKIEKMMKTICGTVRGGEEDHLIDKHVVSLA